MPTQTFWNLPHEKRDALVAVALDEFAGCSYQAASLSRIVARAGIAKGSMYQYFSDKRDLFLFLVAHAAERYYALLRAEEPPPDYRGFFALMRWQMSVGVRVCLREPQLVALLFRARADALPFRSETLEQVRRAGREHIRGYVDRAIAAGEIAPWVTADVATFVIEAVSDRLHESPLIAPLAVGGGAHEGDGTGPDFTAMERVFDAVTRVLEQGLGDHSGGAGDQTNGEWLMGQDADEEERG